MIVDAYRPPPKPLRSLDEVVHRRMDRYSVIIMRLYVISYTWYFYHRSSTSSPPVMKAKCMETGLLDEFFVEKETITVYLIEEGEGLRIFPFRIRLANAHGDLYIMHTFDSSLIIRENRLKYIVGSLAF